MAAPKRTRVQREKDLEQVASLYLRGVKQSEIATQLKLSQQQISYDLADLQKRWKEAALFNLDEARRRELLKLDELERAYWRAYERSCEREERTLTQRSGGAGQFALVERKTSSGDPRYLQGVERCIDRRCKLLGLDAPERRDVTSGGAPVRFVLSWGDDIE